MVSKNTPNIKMSRSKFLVHIIKCLPKNEKTNSGERVEWMMKWIEMWVSSPKEREHRFGFKEVALRYLVFCKSFESSRGLHLVDDPRHVTSVFGIPIQFNAKPQPFFSIWVCGLSGTGLLFHFFFLFVLFIRVVVGEKIPNTVLGGFIAFLLLPGPHKIIVGIFFYIYVVWLGNEITLF